MIPNVLHMFGDSDVWAGLEADEGTRLQKAYQLRRDQVDAILGDYAVQMLEIISAHQPTDDAGRSATTQAKTWLIEIRTASATQLVALLSAELERRTANLSPAPDESGAPVSN